MPDIDPNMTLAMASNSLANNFMQSPMDSADPAMQAPVLTQAHAEYLKRKNGMATSARPSPGGYGAPLAAHVQQAAVQQQVARQQAVNGAVPHEQDYNPAGVTLGQQSDGGRNVELIKGGQSEVQHFNAQGDNTGVLQPNAVNAHLNDMLTGVTPEHAKALQAYAASGATPQQVMAARHQLEGNAATAHQQTFDQANQQQLFQYKDAERVVQQIEKKATGFGGKMRLDKLPPEELARYQQAHQVLTTVGQKLASWGQPPTQQQQAPTSVRDQVLQAQAHFGQQQQQQEPNIPKPPKPGTAMSAQIATQFLQASKGDKDKARKMAKDAGWSF